MRYEIQHDPDPVNPRDCNSKIGTMACFHKRYNLGDSPLEFSSEDFDDWNGMERHVNKISDGMYLPLYLYDHSGITISTTPFSCLWDSGQVGFIYETRKNAIDFAGKTYLTKKIRTQVIENLEATVKEYNTYLTGEYYGYVIYDDKDTIVDSCWGFDDFNYCKQSALDALKNLMIQS
jgi:hypothetical protein